MNPYNVTMNVARITVGYGISRIVTSVVDNNVTPTSVPDRIAIKAGSLAVGTLITDKAWESAAPLVTQAYVAVDNTVKKIKSK